MNAFQGPTMFNISAQNKKQKFPKPQSEELFVR